MFIKLLCLALLGGRFPWQKNSSKSEPSTKPEKPVEEPLEAQQVRVLTWNILAPCYVKSPPPTWVSADALEEWTIYTDWAYRQEAIVNVISSSDADIVCLQEVQVSLCNDLEQLLNDQGYDMHIQDTKGHPVANAILLSKDLDWNVVHKESRSRALILALEQSKETAPIFVVNVHLQASRKSFDENAQTRFSQIQSLLKRVNLAWGRLQKSERTKSFQPSLLIMGDFNLSPDEPLYTLMSQGKWPGDCRNFLPSKVSELTASSLPFLPLQDVRGDYKSNAKPWTYPASLSIVDYIFASCHIETHSQQNYVPDFLSKDSYRARATGEIGVKPRFLWPNESHPSDHIAVGATLRIKQSDR